MSEPAIAKTIRARSSGSGLSHTMALHRRAKIDTFFSGRLERDDLSSNRHSALPLCFAHDLFRKPVSTFRDRALSRLRPLRVHPPAFPAQEHMNASIAVAHAGSGNLLDPFDQLCLTGSTRAIVVGRSLDRQRTASTSNAHPPGRTRMVYHLALPGRLQSFRRMTSCNIALSRDRSATILFSLPFSSSRTRSRLISDGVRPAYFLRQL